MSISGDFSYTLGVFNRFVPPFLPDSVVIRPFGEYGLATIGYATTIDGGYGVNYQSSGSADTTDLVYLWQNDLQAIAGLKRVFLAFYWYTPENSDVVQPAVGPEVRADAWVTPVPPDFTAGPWDKDSSYQLQNTHQVWPSPDDSTLVEGIKWLQDKGYEVGLIPINTFLSNNLYFAGGGEWEIDRAANNWTDLSVYLSSYKDFIIHYIDLCASNSIIPSLFSIGFGLRDLTGIADRSQVPVVIEVLQYLLQYCKANLADTKTTYFADLDEYYYPFGVLTDIDGAMDALWTSPDLDLIGINWFAPLALDNNEDTNVLTQNVIRGEGYDYYLADYQWRVINELPDSTWDDGATTWDNGTATWDKNERLLSTSANDFKTNLALVRIDPKVYAVKNIEDWIVFSHYTPATADMAGCTPPVGVSDPARRCSNIQGNAEVISLMTPLTPATGGIYKAPSRRDTYAKLGTDSNCSFTFPINIPDNTILDFEFDYALKPNQSGNIFQTSFGLALDYVDCSAVLKFSSCTLPLFTAWHGKIRLVYQADSIDVYVNGAFTKTITGTFQMPEANGSMSFGGWKGKLYYIKFILGSRSNLSGGEFYFEDSYSGVPTAWKHGLKKWIAITGYGSTQGSAADPFTRPQTILWNGAANVPLSYENEAVLNAAVFRDNYHAKDIQVPYGSSGAIDQIYQSIVLYSALMGLLPAGPEYISTWFLDTRSYEAMTKTMANGWQIFNDAFDADINASLNGKPIIHQPANQLKVLIPEPTVDGMLSLSVLPGPLPPIRSIPVEPDVPQQ